MDESTSRGRSARPADFSLTNEDLREVAAFATAAAKELDCPAEQDAAQQALDRAVNRATPALLSVLSRYPATSLGTTRVAKLVHCLDAGLRAQHCPEREQR